jgi:hypothetical protein
MRRNRPAVLARGGLLRLGVGAGNEVVLDGPLLPVHVVLRWKVRAPDPVAEVYGPGVRIDQVPVEPGTLVPLVDPSVLEVGDTEVSLRREQDLVVLRPPLRSAG